MIKYTIETDSLQYFDGWSGAIDTLENVKKACKVDELDELFEEVFNIGNPPTVTEVNDWLWFDDEYIYEALEMTEYLDLEED